MCDPVTIGVTTAAVAATSAIVGFAGQKKAYKQNVQAANVTAASDYNELGQRRVQIDAAQSEDMVSRLIDRAAAQGEISASASAYGTGASTVAQLSNAEDNASGRAAAISSLNSEHERQQLNSDAVGVELSRRSQINSVKKPSALSLALGIADAGLKGAGAYSQAGGKF